MARAFERSFNALSDRWKGFSGCTGTPATSGSTQLYASCNGGAQVGLYTIQGGSHAGGPASAAWEFLKTKSLP